MVELKVTRVFKIPRDLFGPVIDKARAIYKEAIRMEERRSVRAEIVMGYEAEISYDPESMVVEVSVLYQFNFGKLMAACEFLNYAEDILAIDWARVSDILTHMYMDKGVVMVRMIPTDKLFDEEATLEFARKLKDEFSRRLFLDGARVMEMRVLLRETVRNEEEYVRFVRYALGAPLEIMSKVLSILSSANSNIFPNHRII